MPSSSEMPHEKEKRKYIRLDNAFPVQFEVVPREGDVFPGISAEKAYTKNVSKEGLCLETDCLTEGTIKYINKENIYLSVSVQTPFKEQPIRTTCEIVWFQKNEDMPAEHYLIGLRFSSILDSDLNLLMKKARKGLFFRFFNRQ